MHHTYVQKSELNALLSYTINIDYTSDKRT